MLLRIDKCGDCPLIFFTETSGYCGHPINWNEKSLDYTLHISTIENENEMPLECPLRKECISIRIK